MDTLLDPRTGDYAGSCTNSLANAVYLRLMTPLGRYWADPKLGSRLHELQRQKDLEHVAVLARQYSEQALEPIIKDGRAASITVTTSRPQSGWLMLHIEVTDAGGRVQNFQHPVRVA